MASPISTLGTAPLRTAVDDKWESMKDKIVQLYVTEDKTIIEVQCILLARFAFFTTPKQLKLRLKKWGFQKNLKSSELSFILDTAKRRRLTEGKETTFRIGGKQVDREKIERCAKRQKDPESAGTKNTPLATPPGLTYQTPSPVYGTGLRSPSTLQAHLMHNMSPNIPFDSEPFGTSTVQMPQNSPPSRIANRHSPRQHAKVATASSPQLAHETLEHLLLGEIPSMQKQGSRSRQDEPVTNVFESASSKAKSRGSVILLHWEDDGDKDSVLLQLRRFEKVFQDVFGFSTEIWAIPDQNCHFRVHFKMLEFAQQGNDDTLLIVYYAGHGQLTDHYRLEWISSQRSDNSSYKVVRWSGIQSTLEEVDSNVLIILDCCASLSTSPEGRGAMECLAAGAFGFQRGSNEFSSVLLDELLTLASYSIPFTIAKLYGRMLQNLQRSWYISQVSPVTPVHVISSEGDKNFQNITLSPVGILQQQPIPPKATMTMATNRFTIPFAGHGASPQPAIPIPKIGDQGRSITSSTPVGESNDLRSLTNMNDTDPSRLYGDSRSSTTSSALASTTDPRDLVVVDAMKRSRETEPLTHARDASIPSTTALDLSFESSTVPKRKRRRGERIYHCTYFHEGTRCSAEFSKWAKWKRHEEIHYPPKRWVCRYEEDSRTDHRTYYRKDFLQQHIRRVHPEFDDVNVDSWYENIDLGWKRQCGFCGAMFDDWDIRCRHIGDHFREGKKMASDWKEPWRRGERSLNAPVSGGSKRINTVVELGSD